MPPSPAVFCKFMNPAELGIFPGPFDFVSVEKKSPPRSLSNGQLAVFRCTFAMR